MAARPLPHAVAAESQPRALPFLFPADMADCRPQAHQRHAGQRQRIGNQGDLPGSFALNGHVRCRDQHQRPPDEAVRLAIGANGFRLASQSGRRGLVTEQVLSAEIEVVGVARDFRDRGVDLAHGHTLGGLGDLFQAAGNRRAGEGDRGGAEVAVDRQGSRVHEVRQRRMVKTRRRRNWRTLPNPNVYGSSIRYRGNLIRNAGAIRHGLMVLHRMRDTSWTHGLASYTSFRWRTVHSEQRVAWE